VLLRTDADLVVRPTTTKRIQTRDALLAAARELVFKRGHEKISIQHITNRAGVATGTFYNYFVTKQDVFEAVVEDYRRQFAEEIEETRSRLKDPAMVIAATLKYYFHQSQYNEQWRTFLLFSGLPGRIDLRQRDADCLKDIQRGVNAGRFKVENSHFAQNLIGGMVDHINFEIAHGRLAPNATDDAVRYILRMLGLPDPVAKALTQSPLPPVSSSHHHPEAIVKD
jgi:AcrR family transcriptional regulator